MSTWIWCELVCIECAAGGPGTHVSGDRVPRKALKNEAKENGWTFRGEESVCDVCSRAEAAAKPTEPTLPTQGEQSHD